jgi:hypothetical protein
MKSIQNHFCLRGHDNLHPTTLQSNEHIYSFLKIRLKENTKHLFPAFSLRLNRPCNASSVITMKKKKSNNKKRILIPLFITFVVVLSISIMVYKGQEPPPKKTPAEYFSFSDVSAFATSVTNSTIRVKLLHFMLTATAGDANHLVIFSPGMTDPADYYHLDDVKNGTTASIEITFPYDVQSVKEQEGFPVDIKIFSDEAEGKITLYIPEAQVEIY